MAAQKWDHKYERKPGRWVFEPTAEYRTIGEKIKTTICKVWKPPSYYFHLRKGGHVLALQRHRKYTYFARFDIEDFFGRINRTRLTRILKPYFSFVVARQMADDSTVRHPTVRHRHVLPYGFVQSPIIASLALAKSRLGTVLDALHETNGMRVSVYVDDVIVSCDDVARLEQACKALTATAEKAGLAFNTAKCQAPAPSITAFHIELTHAGLAIVAERLAEFARDLAAASPQQRKGITGYVNSVSSAQAKLLSR